MKIAIIGAGGVGTTLGGGLAAAGHQIIYAVQDPSDPRHEALMGDSTSVAGVAEAVALVDGVILSTPWAAAESALAAAGDFQGKPLLDATNPIGPGFALTHGHTDSGAEQVARWAPTARVAKVFNSTGKENMADPVVDGRASMMFACSDDEAARSVALSLATDLGFEAVSAGELAMARLLEPLALLWIKLALVHGQGRAMAFGILRRP
jgi:hypothetical protein